MKKLIIFITVSLLTCTSLFATDFYWVGNSGNWTDYTTHWATTSGGAIFHTQTPTSSDNVYFDANSFTTASQIVTIDANAVCADMDWTDALNNPEIYGATSITLSIHGSLTLIEDMNFNFLGIVYFEAISTGKTITSAGQSFKRHVYFNNVGGWELQDGFLQTGGYSVYLKYGTLDLNDMPMTVNVFNSNYTNVRGMIMGDSIFTITSTSSAAFYFKGTNFNFQADSSLIRFTGSGADMDQYSGTGTGLSFFDVIFETTSSTSSKVDNHGGSFNTLTFNNNGTVSGGNTIDTLTFNGNGIINTDGNDINVIYCNSTEDIVYDINGDGTYGEIEILSNATIDGSNTIGDLTLTPGRSYTFNDTENQLITGTLSANGTCAEPITIQSDNETNQTSISKTSGSISIDYCLLQGIQASGGASFLASNTIDMGNNSGWSITAPAPKDLYWIGGTGDWNDPAHWSESSGSTSSNCIPKSIDSVIFDANSFSGAGQIVTIIGDQDSKAYCNSMTWTTGAGTHGPTLAGSSPQTLNIYGSLTLISSMTFSFSGKVYFKASETGKTITTAGIEMDNNYIYFDGDGGEWTLQDDMDIGSQYLYLQKGTLITNNNDVDVGRFYTNNTNTRTLTLGSSVMTITAASNNAFYYNSNGLTLNAGTSTIRFTGDGADLDRTTGAGLAFHNMIFEATAGTSNAQNYLGSFNNLTFNSIGIVTGGNAIDSLTFNGTGTITTNGNDISTTVFHSGATINYDGIYGKVTINGNGSITGTNTFDTLTFTAGNQYTLTSGKIQTIVDTLIANGTSTQYIIIKSLTTGSPTTIRKTSGAVTVSYVQLLDNTADGGATFTANNSIDLGNNSGWTINSPPATNYYWIGGTGEYNVASNWSLSSGGSAGTGVPLSVDNAIFDDQSFDATGQVVTLIGDASNTIRINDMDWSNATNNPSLAGLSTQTLSIYGSLTLNPGMSYTFAGPVYFSATETGKELTTAGLTLDNNHLYFDGDGGEWTLQDDMDIGSQYLYLQKGTLITNNNDVDVGRFYTNNTNTRTLTLGSSEMTITAASNNAFYYNGNNFTLNAGTSTIRFTGDGADLDRTTGAGLAFNNMIFEATAGASEAQNYSGSFNNLTFNSIGKITGGSTIDSLTFNGTGTITTDGNDISTTVFHLDATINYDGIYGKVIMNGNGNITNDNTFDTLIFTAGNQYTLTHSKVQTINNALIAEGTSTDLIVIKSSSTGTHSTFNKTTAGDVVVNYVSLLDNHTTGTAIFTANNSVDLGNTTGWTINAAGPEDYYWVGGTGDYNDASHWATISGGTGGAGVPLASDNVFFDVNSFLTTGQVVTIVGDASHIARANNMDWTGAINNPELAGLSTESLFIHGSLKLISGMTFTFAGSLQFAAIETGKTITTAGLILDNNHMYFDGVGGGWTLQDDLDIGSQYLHLQNGTLITSNNDVDVGRFYTIGTNTRTLTLGSSEMTITAASNNAFYYHGDNFTLNAGTSTIRFTGDGADLNRISGAGLAFHNMNFEATAGTSEAQNYSGSFNKLTFNSIGRITGGSTIDTLVFNASGTINTDGNIINVLIFNESATINNNNGSYGNVTMNGDAYITGSNTFDSLKFTAGKTYSFNSGVTQTIVDTLIAVGTCSSSIIIQAVSASQTNISKSSGTISVSYCNLYRINGTGGATYNAFNSIDQGDNSGWNFTFVPVDLYWVDGTGDWDDVNHWAATSGGAGGYCLPTQSDDVFFDNNSFIQSGQAVFINVADATCRNMDWTGATYAPTFTSTSPSNNLNIFGSLTLIQDMNFAFSGSIYFEGQTPSPSYSITSAGKDFNNNVYCNGIGGIWTLQDDLSISTNNLYLNHGTLNTNDKAVSLLRFISTNSNTRTLNMGASIFNIGSSLSKAWYVNGANFTIVPATSEIKFATANGGLYSTGISNLNYNNILFQNAGGTSTLNSDDSFNSVIFTSFGSIIGGGSYSSLLMNSDGQISGNSTYGTVHFYGNTSINGTNTFSRLLLEKGRTFIFQSGITQTVTGRFLIWGTAVSPIYIQSSTSGVQASVSKSAGTVLGNYIQLQDMAATGGATFDLYTSTDISNNTGWNFYPGTYHTFPNTIITPGPETCSEATETITVAGSGKTFVVQNGGSIKMIAGYLIELLPGTNVNPGGYLNAYITPYGFFCDTISTMPAAEETTEITPDHNNDIFSNDSFLRVYPNPSTGLFTLELKEDVESADIAIEIFTMMGERIAKIDTRGSLSYQIDLTGRQAGIYLIRVTQNKKSGIEKLILQ